jgi:hypothetical protein
MVMAQVIMPIQMMMVILQLAVYLIAQMRFHLTLQNG